MNGYLDIHSHILPGIDDGSKDMDMTMNMLEQAYAEGVRYIVATPHYYPGHRNADPDRIRECFHKVQEVADEQFPEMDIMLGNEIYYKDEAISRLHDKDIFTMNNSRYVLVEFNVGMEYRKIYQAIKRFTMEGYYPIIAHAERYGALHKQEKLVEELVETGAYIQINAETFMGGMFDAYRKYSLRLASNGLVHFLGSDCHEPYERKPIMEQAVKVLKKKIDSDILEDILVHNPKRFLQNEFI